MRIYRVKIPIGRFLLQILENPLWVVNKKLTLKIFITIMPLFVTRLKVSSLFFLLYCIPLMGQEYKVSGHVQQKDGAEVAFANILLYKVADTSFFKGVASNESGFFSFDKIINNHYLIRASYIGSNSDYKLVEVNSDMDIGPLYIDCLLYTSPSPRD